MNWTPPDIAEELYEPPAGTPLSAYGSRFCYRPLTAAQERKAQVGVYGQFLTSLSESELERHIKTDKATAGTAARERTPEAMAEMRRMQWERPEMAADLRRACLYALRSVDGQTLDRPPPAAYDDPAVPCPVNELSAGAVRQLGREVLIASGTIEDPDAEGNG